MPDRPLETGSIQEQWLPDDNDGKDTGYLSDQDSGKSPEITGDECNGDIDGSLYPGRPGVVVVTVGRIEGVNSSTREHDERIDQQQYEDGMAEQIFLS